MSAVGVSFLEEGPRDAPVVLLSNSLGTTIAMWDAQAAALASAFRVIRYDLRGHGSSPLPAGPYRMDDLGADLLALLDRLELERAHLCGISLGGMVSMWVAANAPERVDRLILCCTSARFDNPQAWADRAAAVRAGGTEAVAGTVLGRWFTPAFAAAEPATVARMRAMLVATPAAGYAACCEVVGRTDLHPMLGAIAAPTLVIAGAEDPAAPPDHAKLISEVVARSHVAVLEHAAHLANVERPDAVTELILTHLTQEEP
jgi:3-oxoadipate enol-lactonase